MACPLCGEQCTCSFASSAMASSEAHVSVLIDPDLSENSEAQFEVSLEAVAEEPADTRYRTIELEAPVPRQRRAEPPPPISEEQWRSEVSSHVRRYRRRKGYEDTSACLTLDFESAAAPQLAPEPAAFMDVQFYHDPQDYKPAAQEPLFFRPKREPSETPKVIEFPKPAEELAEPVQDRPRILEAPAPEQLLLEEELPPLAITLDPQPESEPRFGAVPIFELPIQVAPLPLRVMAAGLDWLLVLVAAAVFALVVSRMVESMPQGKAAMGITLVTVGFFWALYQFVFLVYGTLTPGMQFAGLRLQRFDGEHADVNERRIRALALVLSCASVGLGFAWSFVDEDTLCWHDRISRTYVVN